MSVPAGGIETEYGIALLGDDPSDPLHPMYLSHHVLKAWLDAHAAGRTGWDFSSEEPLSDARGHRLGRSEAHPDQLTDIETGLVNTILPNGARLYVDHAHPEYSGPEVTTARDAVAWDVAGDTIVAEAGRLAEARLGRPVRLYKNNTDGKGQAYGCHENYLLHRETPFHRVVTQFTGFLVTRQVFTGAGRVGIGQGSEVAGFQIAQRADFFEREVGLETTMLRPIINTRDEPHADPKIYRRLHVITGDANRSEVATWLKFGTAALVLRAISAGLLPRSRAEELKLAHPVAAMHLVSHDLTCTAPLELADGSTCTALDFQQRWLELCRQYLADHAADLTDAQRSESAEVCDRWQQVLDGLRADPYTLSDQLDWVAKLRLLESYRARDDLAWDAAKLALIDLQYADVDPARSLYRRLTERGRMQRIVDDAAVRNARDHPPPDTRAWFRGRVMAKFGDRVRAASWDSLILATGDGALHRVEMIEPLRGTRELTEQLVHRCDTVEELLRALSGG
ncbi:depupylase/deamidase Dop [Enemella sp. A6]|uniref:depupylase/deamidase Dop n=1 Tax=Enemella sp. A6 TaxID=3440152 RepID=UPI003EB69A3A